MKKQWEVRISDCGAYLHTLPLNDLQEHTYGSDCECDPDVKVRDEEDGEAYKYIWIIHNSFDGREVIEKLEELEGE